jgi:group I intron endonuclease
MTTICGHIYAIRNTINNEVYVGSTTRSIEHRFRQHCYRSVAGTSKLYQLMRQHGIDNFSIELICKYDCDSILALRKKEGHYIEQLGTLNQKRETGRTKAEQRADRLIYYKQYYSHWKAYLQGLKAQKVLCDHCKKVVSKNNIARHNGSKKHQNPFAVPVHV